MVVDENHQSQIDTEPELLVMCMLVSQRGILGQGNLELCGAPLSYYSIVAL